MINMQIEKPMDLMEGIDISRNMSHIIILREAMEGEHHRGR